LQLGELLPCRHVEEVDSSGVVSRAIGGERADNDNVPIRRHGMTKEITRRAITRKELCGFVLLNSKGSVSSEAKTSQACEE